MPFGDVLRNLFGFGRPLIRREPVTYRAIGVVRNQIRELRTSGWEDVRSDIFLRDDLAEALEGIEGFSHVIVLFHMDRISDQDRVLLKLPLSDENGGEIGLFATRIPVRPNALGVSAVPIIWRRKNVLRVQGLDALNGTPVLDLKPYLAKYDALASATTPEWARRAMGE
ncbi:MAG TPA: tRNA (N6-threonylcarbamoyladenosine(37)-N6)-methyltransferase TrmO [Dehalococcoidia bacterium]